MTRPDLSLREIRLILAVAEHRSFTDAAATVHMSQSALSRAVNASERQLGSRLFLRTTRSVKPTPAGSEFVRLGQDLVERHERALREFALFRDGLGGVVRIAALPSIAATILPPVVASLRESLPDVVVDIDDTLAHLATERLVAADVDFAITVADDLRAGLDFSPLSSDRFWAVFRPDHRFRGRERVRWREIAQEPLVSFSSASSIRTVTDETFASLGIDIGETVEARNIAVIAGLVAAGLGCAAVPELALPLMRFANLSTAPMVEPEVDRTIGLARVPGRSISPAATHVAEVIATHLANQT